MDATFRTAPIIIFLAYPAIISKKTHKMIMAVFGAELILVLNLLEQREAFRLEEFGVDWNAIFLLISMMVIINLMRPTGAFEYIAIKSAKPVKGDPFRIARGPRDGADRV